MLVVAPVTMILGVGTAIYLEIYAKKGKVTSIIQTNISNLSGCAVNRLWDSWNDSFCKSTSTR